MNRKWVEQKTGFKNIVKKAPKTVGPLYLYTSPFFNRFREWAHFIYYPFTNHFSTLTLQKGADSVGENWNRKKWWCEKYLKFHLFGLTALRLAFALSSEVCFAAGLDRYDAIIFFDNNIEFQGDVTPLLRCASAGAEHFFSFFRRGTVQRSLVYRCKRYGLDVPTNLWIYAIEAWNRKRRHLNEFKCLCRSSCFRFPFSICLKRRSSFSFVFQAISLQPMERTARSRTLVFWPWNLIGFFSRQGE